MLNILLVSPFHRLWRAHFLVLIFIFGPRDDDDTVTLEALDYIRNTFTYNKNFAVVFVKYAGHVQIRSLTIEPSNVHIAMKAADVYLDLFDHLPVFPWPDDYREGDSGEVLDVMAQFKLASAGIHGIEEVAPTDKIDQICNKLITIVEYV